MHALHMDQDEGMSAYLQCDRTLCKVMHKAMQLNSWQRQMHVNSEA